MVVRNKKTGKVLAVESISLVVPTLIADKKTIQLTGTDTETGYREMYRYKSLAELNSEWEDMPEEAPEEPKEYWYMDYGGRIKAMNDANDEEDVARKQIGNYFETKEEAELAVEKLKAWKRLKDKGFRFQGWEDLEAIELPIKHYNNIVGFKLEDNNDVIADLNTLFGGEE